MNSASTLLVNPDLIGVNISSPAQKQHFFDIIQVNFPRNMSSEKDPGKKITKEILKETLAYHLVERVDEMLTGTKGYKPNNYRLRGYTIDRAHVDDWLKHPQEELRSRVTTFFKEYEFEQQARLLVGSTDPWQDGYFYFEGSRFIQLRLTPTKMQTGAVVYALVIREREEYYKPTFRVYEEIPYLSMLPGSLAFIPKMNNIDPKDYLAILNRYNTFLDLAFKS